MTASFSSSCALRLLLDTPESQPPQEAPFSSRVQKVAAFSGSCGLRPLLDAPESQPPQEAQGERPALQRGVDDDEVCRVP